MRYLLPIFLILTQPALGEMYRWTDSEGQIHYTQTPPTGKDSTSIKAPPPPSAPTSYSTSSAKAESDLLEKEVKNADKKDAELVASSKKKNCDGAKNNLSGYEALGRKIVKLPDGTYTRYDEDERQKKIKEAQDQIKKYCN